jgi:hypothetical protein
MQTLNTTRETAEASSGRRIPLVIAADLRLSNGLSPLATQIVTTAKPKSFVAWIELKHKDHQGRKKDDFTIPRENTRIST